MLYNVDHLLFDPLGRNGPIYMRLVEALPAELKHKLVGARYGVLNAGAEAPPPSDAELLADELRRAVLAGKVIPVTKNEDGEIVAELPPEYEGPEKIEGENAQYGVLAQFAGAQTIFIPVPLSEGIATEWVPTEEAVAFMALNIR